MLEADHVEACHLLGVLAAGRRNGLAMDQGLAGAERQLRNYYRVV
jgi:hypothetical protein